MTISGLGSAPMYSPAMPPNRARRTPPATHERTEFDSLTRADRELILNVTGERVMPGFDPATQHPTAFAAVLAHERATGRLAPGQEASAVYLKDLSHRYELAGGPNPVAAHLREAVAYLSRSGARRIDVSA